LLGSSLISPMAFLALNYWILGSFHRRVNDKEKVFCDVVTICFFSHWSSTGE